MAVAAVARLGADDVVALSGALRAADRAGLPDAAPAISQALAARVYAPVAAALSELSPELPELVVGNPAVHMRKSTLT